MAMLSLDYFIDNYIYFYHLGESGEYIILPTYPTTIADSMGSTFNQTNALSRSAPVQWQLLSNIFLSSIACST